MNFYQIIFVGFLKNTTKSLASPTKTLSSRFQKEFVMIYSSASSDASLPGQSSKCSRKLTSMLRQSMLFAHPSSRAAAGKTKRTKTTMGQAEAAQVTRIASISLKI
jgi:hypothetical protein